MSNHTEAGASGGYISHQMFINQLYFSHISLCAWGLWLMCISVGDIMELGFLGGAVDKNPSVSAWNTSSVPGLRRSHMLQSN